MRQHHLLRRIVDCSRASENTCYLGEAPTPCWPRWNRIFDISEERHDAMLHWPRAVDESVEAINHILDMKKGITGIPTGYPTWINSQACIKAK